MKIRKKNKSMLSCVKHTLSACIITVVISVSAGSAGAFDTYQGTIAKPVRETLNMGETSLIAKSPPPSMVDMCLPLLNSIHHTPSNSAMDRNQRSAGETATLGLVFGVKFALTPSYKASSSTRNKAASFYVWHPQGSYAGNQQALAVSAYSQCQREQVFNALSNIRWKK